MAKVRGKQLLRGLWRVEVSLDECGWSLAVEREPADANEVEVTCLRMRRKDKEREGLSGDDALVGAGKPAASANEL